MLALVVRPPAFELELAADALWSLGVLAVEERTGPHGPELWTMLGDDPAVIAGRLDRWPPEWRWELVDIDATVADTWRDFAVPTRITDELYVVPAWIDAEIEGGARCVRIEPGETFGLGDHPTTVLSARAMLDVLEPGSRLADIGCGSGVLSVVGALCGAATVDALDIHPAAVGTTLANARRNGVAGRVRAGSWSLADLDGPYDVIVANILAPVLVGLAPQMCRLVRPGGAIVISGILADRHDHVLGVFCGLEVEATLVLDGWAAVTLRDPG